jgi:hypothetical protein
MAPQPRNPIFNHVPDPRANMAWVAEQLKRTDRKRFADEEYRTALEVRLQDDYSRKLSELDLSNAQHSVDHEFGEVIEGKYMSCDRNEERFEKAIEKAIEDSEEYVFFDDEEDAIEPEAEQDLFTFLTGGHHE